MAADDDAERAPERPDPAGAAARSMTQLAEQMQDMAQRMLGGALAWPTAGQPVAGGAAAGSGRPAGQRTSAEPAAGAGDRPLVPGLPAIPGMPPMAGLPATPVAMSARQVQAIVDDIGARRSQVKALVVQLEAFDEQLGTLEASLGPLLQWLRTWADLEGSVTDFWTGKPPRS